jgi:ubiquinone/menaquinone biosynthesis C-methylase UbiE
VDFLAGQAILHGAAGARFDLAADAEIANQLAERASELTVEALLKMKTELTAPSEASATATMNAAQRRFNRRYRNVESEVMACGQAGIVHKVAPYLASIGHRPLGGVWALEAGGGHGHFLADFASMYHNVILADCSLTLIIIARRNAEERGVTNVHYIRCDATLLPLASDSMDWIHENNIIEHVADPQALVSEGTRVLSQRGVYVIVSPNRYPITPEPHFRVPLFGAVPRPVRRWLIPRVRGVSSEAGTDLRSLGQLRSYLRGAGEEDVPIFFLPRQLEYTVRRTVVRRIVRVLLSSRVFGGGLNILLNRVLLHIMPSHIAIVARGGYTPDDDVYDVPVGTG